MKSYRQEKGYWVSSSGFLGKSFYFQTLDLEIENNIESFLDNFLKTLSQNVRVKISLFQEFSKQCSDLSSRTQSIREVGFFKHQRFYSL